MSMALWCFLVLLFAIVVVLVTVNVDGMDDSETNLPDVTF